MTETRLVVVCRRCAVSWPADGSPATCADPDHVHETFEVHRHRSRVALPDGSEVTAVSFDGSEPYTRDNAPQYGLYLDDRWHPPWAHDHVEWPDFGIPDTSALVDALERLREKIRAGERVEIGCLGGHGRTGTALACLLVLIGHPRDDAVRWVRENYCPKAIETAEQEAFVTRIRD
jgi:hypothetical protein